MTKEILIVDDEADIRELIADILKDQGYETRLAQNSDTALKAMAERVPSAIILDIWLQGSELDGLGILELIKKKHPHIPVIMISGHGNIETAVKAIKIGAYDFIEKPFKEERLLLMLSKAIEMVKLREENSELKRKGQLESTLHGNSNVISSVRAIIQKVASTSSRVLIQGAPGTGKELLARMIHTESARRKNNFVSLNVSGLSPEQVDNELFGVEENKLISGISYLGALERAHGGTLFIDEIADMPPAIQGKILRVLQENSFTRVNGTRTVDIDVRVIAATNKDLTQEIAEGHFREELYYRLNVVPIHMPALMERREDIPELCEHFLKRAAELHGRSVRQLASDAVAMLQSYNWPGNVRQLRNMMEWLTIMTPDSIGAIKAEQLPQDILYSNPLLTRPEVNADIMSLPLREARELFERQYLAAQIERFGGNISKTSLFIGMERSALHRKLKMLGLAGNDASAEEQSIEKSRKEMAGV